MHDYHTALKASSLSPAYVKEGGCSTAEQRYMNVRFTWIFAASPAGGGSPNDGIGRRSDPGGWPC